jgi:adenosine deaminase
MSWYEQIPKVELHLHLEGAIPHEALWELACKYGGDPEVPDIGALLRRFEYRDFPHFIETWIWKNGFIREYDDFTLIAEAVGRDLLSQNILYVEAYFSPRDFARHGLEAQGIAGAIRRGLDRVPEVEVMLIPDLIRDFGPENAARTLAELVEVRDEAGIIGIGIGGSEQSFPPEPFAPVYEEARRLGLCTTAHAGEVAGAESIWGALRTLGVERIGHGTRAYEDPALLDYLAERRVPVEMCPISNVKTRVVPSIEQHPIRRYFDHGILVTVNTDDPKMFGNSLAEEYTALVDHLGFTHDDVRTLILNAIESSWMDETRKGEMREQFSGMFSEVTA